MTGYILVCSCSGQWKKAAEAFALMFPTTPLPEIIKGRNRIYELAMKTNSQHLKAISKLNGKYSYYAELDGDGIIRTEIDLITGRRIA